MVARRVSPLARRLAAAHPGDDRAAAERLYREAISVAAGQQAKSLELRAATSLALLLGETGAQRPEGYAVLAPRSTAGSPKASTRSI